MKTFKELMQEAGVLWPGTPEYKKAFPDTDRSAKAKPGTMTKGNRHDIKTTATGVVATRRFDKDDEAAEPTKPAEPAVKRGRGRPPGKYGTYTKRKVAEAFEILDQLEYEEDIDSFLETLDEETLAEMSEIVEEVELDEAAKGIPHTVRFKHADPSGKGIASGAITLHAPDKTAAKRYAMSDLAKRGKKDVQITSVTAKTTNEDVELD
jgi:hypothetical protein